MRRFILSASLSAVLAAPALATDAQDRVVTIGGDITEIVYALGQQDRLVARDTTSNFPADVLDLPDIGYARALSPEGVLSIRPDLIIASDNSGPPETIEVLQEAGITFVPVPEIYTPEGIARKITIVGDALGQGEAAQARASPTPSQRPAVTRGASAGGSTRTLN